MARVRTEWRDNPDVVAELRNLTLALRGTSIAVRFWNRALSESERQRLGGDLEEVWTRVGLVGLYRQLHPVPRNEAVLEISRRLGMVDESTYSWLCAELGIRRPTRTPGDRPQWRPETGELLWKGRVVRTVRRFQKPSSIVNILELFQSLRWPRRVRNSLQPDAHKLHEAVRSLNNGLTALRFRVSDGAEFISWELA